jgi:hypothetical protein
MNAKTNIAKQQFTHVSANLKESTRHEHETRRHIWSSIETLAET